MTPSQAALEQAANQVDEPAKRNADIEISPDQIASMSQKALKSCENAARELRELGDYALTLGERTKDEIHKLASDFEQHGRTVAKQVVNYATDICSKATQARELRKTIPQSGPRIVPKGFQSQTDHG